MAASIETRVIELGLNVLDTETTTIAIYANATEPTSLATATGAGRLGYASWTAGGAFGTPGQVGTPETARGVTSTNITGTLGTVTTTGTAGWWGCYDSTAFHAHGTLAATAGVSAGSYFTLSQFSISVPHGA